jgi:hypothetical protein
MVANWCSVLLNWQQSRRGDGKVPEFREDGSGERIEGDRVLPQGNGRRESALKLMCACVCDCPHITRPPLPFSSSHSPIATTKVVSLICLSTLEDLPCTKSGSCLIGCSSLAKSLRQSLLVLQWQLGSLQWRQWHKCKANQHLKWRLLALTSNNKPLD